MIKIKKKIYLSLAILLVVYSSSNSMTLDGKKGPTENDKAFLLSIFSGLNEEGKALFLSIVEEDPEKRVKEKLAQNKKDRK